MPADNTSVSTGSPARTKAFRGQRKSSSLPAETVDYLKNWMMSPEHIAHPYPTDQEKAEIMAATGIELKQLTNWFVNNRKRFWKPRVEARLQQQAQAQAAAAVASAHAAAVAVAATSVKVSPVSPDQQGKPQIEMSKRDFSGIQFPGSHRFSALMQTGNEVTTQEQVRTVHVVAEASTCGSEDDSSITASEGSSPEVSASESETESIVPYQTQDKSGGNVSDETISSSPTRKRSPSIDEASMDDDSVENSPRRKFRRVSLDSWRDACKEATNMYCQSLPTLEEATQLFGFAN